MDKPDVLYGCDARWWTCRDHAGTVELDCLKYSLEICRGRQDVTVLKQGHHSGLSLENDTLNTGGNSGYQAINLAVLLGAVKIVLLGFDMQPARNGRHHWFGKHSYASWVPNYALYLPRFPTLVKPLKELGVSVINASRVSALECFPKMRLEEAL